MQKFKAYHGKSDFIFISYSHRDMEQVFPVLTRMSADGFLFWFDEGIDPGTEWANSIAAHVESCGYFIAFMSNNYLNSQNCRDEIEYARDLGKKIVILYLEDVALAGGMAMRFNRYQKLFKYKYTDENEFFQKLYRAEDIENFRKKFAEEESEVPESSENTSENIISESTAEAVGESAPAPSFTRIEYPNGDIYEGETKNGKRHGRGKLTHTGGNCYDGEWREGLRSGNGVFYFSNGDTYEGDFLDGVFHGNGRYTYANGKTFCGVWQNGKRVSAENSN